MSLIDKLIGLIAPHSCIKCGEEGSVVCGWCLPGLTAPLPSRCYACRAATTESRVCSRCRRKSRLRHVWVRTTYDGAAKQLVYDFKFGRKIAAAEPIALMMKEPLPHLPADTVIAHIPTATSRVRQRGYDHAELLAGALARQLGLRHEALLYRTTQSRQVGSKRADRLRQMEEAFMVKGGGVPRRRALLVDDLTTTGATLEAAARCLKSSGVKEVSAVVYAQK